MPAGLPCSSGSLLAISSQPSTPRHSTARVISERRPQRFPRRTIERRMRACDAGRSRSRLVITHHVTAVLAYQSKCTCHHRQCEYGCDDRVKGCVHGTSSLSQAQNQHAQNQPAVSQLVPCSPFTLKIWRQGHCRAKARNSAKTPVAFAVQDPVTRRAHFNRPLLRLLTTQKFNVTGSRSLYCTCPAVRYLASGKGAVNPIELPTAQRVGKATDRLRRKRHHVGIAP